MKPYISVIVPVYNTANYLRKCLESIKNQDYNNYECIMIDDGSADDSADICREYAEIDDRFVLLQQENRGVSSARNAGLNRACGDYILFVDSDDYLGGGTSLA